VVADSELLSAVDAAFEVTGRGLARWPDPQPDRPPLDEEYSRVTNAGKWRIVGARADAWLVALADARLAAVERDEDVHWKAAPRTAISRTDRLVPYAAGARPLVVARSRIDGTDDAGVTLGVGHPAVCVARIPSCGCDACDSGAQPEIDQLDAVILPVVLGAFRRLSKGSGVITVFGDGSWSATGVRARDVPAILAEPSGWDELSGTSWLGEH
jgi:hypothetical protein